MESQKLRTMVLDNSVSDNDVLSALIEWLGGDSVEDEEEIANFVHSERPDVVARLKTEIMEARTGNE